MTIINISAIKATKALTAGQYMAVYETPMACVSATVNIRTLSRNLAADSKIRLAIVPVTFIDGVTPPPDDCYIQPLDLILGPNGLAVGMFEDSGLVLVPGETLVAYCDNGNVTIRMHGFIRTIS